MCNGSKKFLAILVVAAGLVGGATSEVRAATIPWGDPVLSHSWDQLWVTTSDQQFNRVVATIVAPPLANFESPGFLDFSADDWIITSATAREMVAQGPATDRLEFTTHFSGDPTDYSSLNPLIINLLYFNGSTFIEGHQWTWDGAEWVDPHIGPDGQPIPHVPDGGSTLLFLGLSLVGGSVFLRKRLAGVRK